MPLPLLPLLLAGAGIGWVLMSQTKKPGLSSELPRPQPTPPSTIAVPPYIVAAPASMNEGKLIHASQPLLQVLTSAPAISADAVRNVPGANLPIAPPATGGIPQLLLNAGPYTGPAAPAGQTIADAMNIFATNGALVKQAVLFFLVDGAQGSDPKFALAGSSASVGNGPTIVGIPSAQVAQFFRETADSFYAISPALNTSQLSTPANGSAWRILVV